MVLISVDPLLDQIKKYTKVAMVSASIGFVGGFYTHYKVFTPDTETVLKQYVTKQIKTYEPK